MTTPTIPTQMLIGIYHRTDDWRFLSIEDTLASETGEPRLELAYTYEGDPDLNRIFRANNRVDGSAVEVIPEGHRSLSVGDVVVTGEIAFTVDPVGWSRVDPDVLRKAMS